MVDPGDTFTDDALALDTTGVEFVTPLLQTYVNGPVPVNTTLKSLVSPKHITLLPAMVAVGSGFTLSVWEVVPTHPLISVTVTVYVPAFVGLMMDPVEPSDQTNEA